MALVRETLKQAIIAAGDAAQQAGINAANSGGDPVAVSKETFAELLSVAIDAYIRSGTVNTNVVTSGSPTSHTGVGIGSVS